MVDVAAIRESLAQTTQSTRVVIRCFGGGKDSQETSQRALSLLCDLLDLLYRVKDQLSWAEEKWIVEASRLNALHELLVWFDTTLRSIELYFQPGGIGVRYFRKYLLEQTFIPRLEQYKILLILSMQPDSDERSSLDRDIRSSLRRQVEPANVKRNIRYEDDVLGVPDRLLSEDFITLADLCNRRQQGTCQWFLRNDKYKQWLLGSFRTLYCLGPPGAGKTFLSSAVIDSLQRTFTSPDVAVVFIFCDNEREKEQTLINLLQNILAQLVYRKRSLSNSTSSLYHFESFSKGRASSKAYQNAIRAEVNRFSKVFLVIDGLDGFPEKDRLLNRLQKLPEHAQLLVTLREAKNLDKINYVNARAPEEDLCRYILSRIHRDASLAHLVDEDDYSVSDLQEDILQAVIEKSHGLFLLAQLHMDLLSRYDDRNLVQRALLHLPESLDEAYAEALKLVVNNNNQYASRYIYWVLYACRPLTVAELKSATRTEPQKGKVSSDLISFEHTLLADSAGLLTIDAVTGTVHLVHKTAREYLTRIAARVFFPSAQKEIAETCLVAISSDEVVDNCYLNRESAPRNSSSGILNYAATYWGYHALLTKTFLNKLSWRRPPPKGDSPMECNIPRELGVGRYPEDWTPLHVLAYFGADVNDHDNSQCMVEFLLNRGADINATTENGNTALHLATEKGHRKVMKLLLSRKVNVEITNRKGAPALHVAVGTANDEATVPLLNVLTKDTALHLAVEYKRPRILLFLLDRGWTPLQLAAKTDNCEALTLLLDRGAQVETRPQSGLTALHLAANDGNWVALDLLLIGGADINAWNTKESSDISIAAKLLDQGANIEARTSQGYTPLQCAAMSGNKEMFIFLLTRGAKIDIQTPRGETLLHITPPCNQDCLEILQILLDSGLNVNATSTQGWTPLHQTTSEYIDLLLSYGADINTPSMCAIGGTPLHLATIATVPRPSLVAFLLTRGASVNATTNDGKTALHLAAERGRESIFRILLDAGADTSVKTPPTSTAATYNGYGVSSRLGGGDTPFDLARKNPLGALWFNDDGSLRPPPVRSRRGSTATIIEDVSSESETEIGGRKKQGGDGAYI
ncbi:NACHT and ankyrin domain protein [Thermoascus aurantiacus ATCC 26904]